MKMATALHTVKQRSRPGGLLTELRPVKDNSRRSNLQAQRKHLSDDWSPKQGGSNIPVQTMSLAAALHTVRQHSPPGCLQAELRAVRDVSRKEGPMGLETAPVR